MEFNEKIAQLKEKAVSQKENLKSEEATKNALIMPFLNALGYDVFDPLEVVPEYLPDRVSKKDERIDYAILKEGQPIILVECKRVENEKLDINKHGSQLFKYFTASKAKFIIFTNGIVYKFFTDGEGKQTNILDKEPFLTFNLLDYKESQLVTIQEYFTKDNFDIEKAFNVAGNLKYIRSFEEVIENEYKQPSDDFVKYLLDKSAIYDGVKTSKVIEKHKKTTVEAFNLFMSKVMKTSLDFGHMNKEEGNKNEIVTTLEELEGYAIVKAIMNGIIDLNRIYYKDTASYFNITLDKNINKTICRLYFNGSVKYLAIISAERDEKGRVKEDKIKINSVNEIFDYADRIKARINELN